MSNCYRYIVCWQEAHRLCAWDWKHKSFANRKEAKRFAKSKHIRGRKPKPYIVTDIVDRTYFRSDVPVEEVKED